MEDRPPHKETYSPSPALTGCAVTGIIILGLGEQTALAVPIGFIAGAIATYTSILTSRRPKSED